MQDAEDYFPLRFRSALVPIVNIGSNLGWILIMIGLFLKFTELAWLGVLVFAGGAVFALATLPVEFNASARAKQLLVQTGIIQTDEEQRGVNTVLNAAALTYVAGSGHRYFAIAILCFAGAAADADNTSQRRIHKKEQVQACSFFMCIIIPNEEIIRHRYTFSWHCRGGDQFQRT